MQSRAMGMGRHLLLHSVQATIRAQPAATWQETVPGSVGQRTGKGGLQERGGSLQGQDRRALSQLVLKAHSAQKWATSDDWLGGWAGNPDV